jgi:hypothetical protein
LSADPCPFHCSFCGYAAKDVDVLLESPTRRDVSICNHCVALCNAASARAMKGAIPGLVFDDEAKRLKLVGGRP